MHVILIIHRITDWACSMLDRWYDQHVILADTDVMVGAELDAKTGLILRNMVAGFDACLLA